MLIWGLSTQVGFAGLFEMARRRAAPRGLLLSLPAALAIVVAAMDRADARHYTSYALRHNVISSIPHATAPAPSVAVDPDAGPLVIPKAALEPAGWGDLDGWTGDDHASAFATFYASCRPIVRANAFRAESARTQSARN
jgi:hypothetical protein